MSTTASIRLPATDFALGDTFDVVPDAEFEVPPVVAHGKDQIMPFLLATGGDPAAIEDALGSDGSVDQISRMSETQDGVLFHVEWSARVRTLFGAFTEAQASVLSVFGSNGRWHLRAHFPGRESLSTAYRFFENNGVTIELERINEFQVDSSDCRLGLSEQQHTTLTLGLERGFYSIPRGIDTCGLADELGISHQAVSERLRRAHGTLIRNALLTRTRPLA